LLRLLYGKITRLDTLKNLVNVRRGASLQVGDVHAVAHKSTVFHIAALRVCRRKPALCGESGHYCSLSTKYRPPSCENCVSNSLFSLSNCSLDIQANLYVQVLNVH